jgi:hypothetical protein
VNQCNKHVPYTLPSKAHTMVVGYRSDEGRNALSQSTAHDGDTGFGEYGTITGGSEVDAAGRNSRRRAGRSTGTALCTKLGPELADVMST